jgi:PadR family transcriptional regulator, regulatory protein AphA
MSLMHAILGFLRREPQTGYSLKNDQFDKSVGYFWPADQTQIYKTLDKLVESELATCEVEIQSDRPNRKIYSISKAGKLELERWLSEPSDPPPYREPLLVKLFFSEYVKTEDMLEVLANARLHYQAHLDELTSIEIAPIGKCNSREELGARLTLEMGLQSKRAAIAWVDQAMEALESFEPKNKKDKKHK